MAAIIHQNIEHDCMKSEFGKEAYVLDKIPFEEQRVIDELVKLWQTHSVPRDLAMHIDKLPSTWGRHIVRNFFRQVYEDLRTDKRSSYAAFSASVSIIRDGRPMKTDKRSNYAAFSASEFKRLLETEYSQWVQIHAEPQAWAKADAEAKEREDLAPHIGIRHPYENVCWRCDSPISSTIHVRCKVCGWYICRKCGSCSPVCNKTYNPVKDEAVDLFPPDYPDDLS
jgi:hypothetical protein